MNISRRNFIASAGVLAAGALAGCGNSKAAAKGSGTGSASAAASYTVGVIQLTEHAALDAANEGFCKMLDNNGDGLVIKIDQQNAQNDQSACKTIASKFVGDNVDLIFAIATPAAQAALSETTEIPIVGTAITDFAASALVSDNEKPGGNVTGSSDLTPVAEQIEMMHELLPEVKNVAVLWASNESNSQIQAETAKDKLKELGLSGKDYTVSSSNEIQSVVESAVADKVDAIYSPTDNTIAAAAAQVGQICTENKIPFVTGEKGMCEAGGLFTLSIDYEHLGELAGEMALKILKGEGKPADMPIEYEDAADLEVYVNEETEKALGLDLSAIKENEAK